MSSALSNDPAESQEPVFRLANPKTHGLSEPVAVDAHTAGAWTRGSFAYLRRPLAEVVEDVQRYSRRRIVVDTTAAGFTYSGTVQQPRVAQWVTGLAEIFPVEVLDCTNLSALPGMTNARSRCSDYPNSIVILARPSDPSQR